MLTVVTQEKRGRVDGTSGGSVLDEIVRDGARRMLTAALEAEVDAYIDAHADQVDAVGRRLVIRNGSARRGRCSRPRARWGSRRRGSTTGAPMT